MSVDPRRTQPFCEPRCYRECRCSRWPDYKNRWGEYVVPHDDSAPWTPALPLPVSGLLPDHWYISDQGLWQDAGINPAVADGDPVGRWEDITANADHVNQAAAGNKPTLQNGAGDLLNGHPVIRFDGINDYLRGAFTTGGAMAHPNTIFAVARLDAALVNDGVSHNITDGSVAGTMYLYKSSVPNPDGWGIYGGAGPLYGTAADNDWNIWTVVFNGVASRFWHNGIAECAAGNAGLLGVAGLTVGAIATGGQPWKDDVTEIILYDANLSDADKNTVGDYLATRYGLAYTDI